MYILIGIVVLLSLILIIDTIITKKILKKASIIIVMSAEDVLIKEEGFCLERLANYMTLAFGEDLTITMKKLEEYNVWKDFMSIYFKKDEKALIEFCRQHKIWNYLILKKQDKEGG